MGLKGFIQDGYYSKISYITVDMDREEVNFNIRTFKSRGGEEVIAPAEFRINREFEVNKFTESLPPINLTPPPYPEVCSAREALVPMWPDGTPQPDINEYNNALITYNAAMDAYKKSLEEAKVAKITKAAKDNDYDKYFGHRKLFITSNPLACAYTYLKTLDSFVGVNDAED